MVNLAFDKIEGGKGCAAHHTGRDPGNRMTNDLGDKGHGPAGPRIDLQDENLSILDGILNIHQPDHTECLGKSA